MADRLSAAAAGRAAGTHVLTISHVYYVSLFPPAAQAAALYTYIYIRDDQCYIARGIYKVSPVSFII